MSRLKVWAGGLVTGGREAILRPGKIRRVGERVERSATLEWAGETRKIVLSGPAWVEPWVEADAADALVLAALPWLETSTEGVRLRVCGTVSAELAARLRRRLWLRRERGETSGGVEVRAEVMKRTPAGRRERAALHYRGDGFSVAAAVELAAGHRLYPRPGLAVGAEPEPGGEAGREFLRGLGLRYAEVRVERPGPERAAGGAVDAAARLRFLGAGFGTGYVSATAAYRYAEPEAGEPDADLDPLFSGAGMRIVHVGAERSLAGVMAALRRAGPAVPANLVAAESEARVPVGLWAAGLALIGAGPLEGVPQKLGALDFGRDATRWTALDFLRWLRAEPELAAAQAGRLTEEALRTGMGLAAGAVLPKAVARNSPLAAALNPPDAGGADGWRPWRAQWTQGQALVSGNGGLVKRDLEPIASWLRLRAPGFAAGAVRTQTLRKWVRYLPWLAPRSVLDMHPAPERIRDFAELICGRGMPKSEEMTGLERTGVAVPRWKVLQPGEKVTEAEFGRYVVVKPDKGLRGACVRVQKTAGVKGDPIYVEFSKSHSAPLVQEFIYTGPQPVSYRVGVLFGKAIYRWRVEGRKVEGRELPTDGDFRARSGVSVVSTGTGCEFSDPFDHEVIAFAERAAAAFPGIPLMGVDVARRLPDRKLFVLELNASGYCFHLTSELGRKMQATTYLELAEQYGGFPYCADLIRLAYEADHGW